MEGQNFSELERDLGRALVYQIAPEEVPFFDEILDRKHEEHIFDHPLAFGVSDSIEFSTIAIMAVAQFLVSSLAESVKSAAVDILKGATDEFRTQANEKIKTLIKNMFNQNTSIGLSQDQKNEIIQSSIEIGRNKGLTEKQTKILLSSLEKIL